jgi:hypothetical protein
MNISIGTIWLDGENIYRTISDYHNGRYASEHLEVIEDIEPHHFPEYELVESDCDADGIVSYSKFYSGSFPAKLPVICR